MPFDKFLQSATGSFVGDLIGSTISYQRDKKSAKRQMNFQERMSSTAYQRAMNDMRKAGINPLMVSKLGGASTPTGASIPSKDLSKVGSNAVKNATTASQIQNLQANTRNTNEQSKVHSSTVKVNSAKAKMLEEQAITEELKQQTERATYTAKRIANSMSQFEFNYFKKLGYPPKVLTARVENVVGTYLWENLPEDKKVSFTRFVYDQVGKLGSKVNQFTNNPDTMLEKWWKEYRAMNPFSLPNIYGVR